MKATLVLALSALALTSGKSFLMAELADDPIDQPAPVLIQVQDAK